MKKFVLTFLALFLFTSFGQSQTKFSYSVLVNQSASADSYTSICILRAPPLRGVCFDLEGKWKTNITFATNYEPNKKIRIQSGIAYNTYHQDVLNRQLSTDRYTLKFLSIPIRTHYFITREKVRLFAGLGLRTDIRLNKAFTPIEGSGVNDNARSFGLSAEALLGLEVPVSPQVKLSLEPTFSAAITNYAKDTDASQIAFADGVISEKPKRIGISIGVTYTPIK